MQAPGLDAAEQLLVELYDLHDFFFSPDKAEKQVHRESI
jgi:hypothetical protein